MLQHKSVGQQRQLTEERTEKLVARPLGLKNQSNSCGPFREAIASMAADSQGELPNDREADTRAILSDAGGTPASRGGDPGPRELPGLENPP